MVKTGIDDAISQLEDAIETPITVSIDFEDNTSISLGDNITYGNDLPYTQYLTDLENNQILSAADRTALASLPATTDNPVNGNADVHLTLPLLRAIGETTLGDNDINGLVLDGTIGLNIPEMNVSRMGTQDASDYDLEAVALHEMDEVLGIGGQGSNLASGSGSSVVIGPLDLYRYSARGVRSFAQGIELAPYFSIDSGTTELVHFTQDLGGDYGDWGNGSTPAEGEGNDPAQVQDAFATQGEDVNLGINERTALDVVGYNLVVAVPEPRGIWLVAGGVMAIGITRRRSRRAV